MNERVWMAVSVVALCLGLGAGCGGDDDGGDDGAAGAAAGAPAAAGAGGSTAGAGGSTAGSGGSTAGSGGSMAPVMCGTSTCMGAGFFQACCLDAATNTCGIQQMLIGIPCGVPGVADPSCPPASIMLAGMMISLDGCCTADGMCGGFAMGSPCRTIPASIGGGDDDGGTAAPQSCTPP